MSRGDKKIAVVGRSLSETTWQGRHSDVQCDSQFFIANERNASHAVKLAVVDALLYVAEHTPPGFRSLRRNDIAGEHWTNTWAEYVVHLAKFNGVVALLANLGVFLIAERATVCHEDEFGRPANQVEPGWQRVKLCSIDGKARPHDREAPQILISPDEQCFLWQPEGGPKNQKRLTFMELLAELGDMGERLARFKKVEA